MANQSTVTSSVENIPSPPQQQHYLGIPPHTVNLPFYVQGPDGTRFFVGFYIISAEQVIYFEEPADPWVPLFAEDGADEASAILSGQATHITDENYPTDKDGKPLKSGWRPPVERKSKMQVLKER